jgi:hypothetical protein
MQRTNPDWKSVVYCWIVISVVMFFLGCRSQIEASRADLAAVPSPTNDSQKVATVNEGDPDSAVAYYGETLTELGLNPNNVSAAELVGSMKLSQVMAHLGYPGLDLKDVEDLPSAELMKRYPGDILSSAFFAPKITDVSVKPIVPGWRKLVRFKAKGEALKKGISAGFLLFNKFQPDLDKDPFGDQSHESENTQLILIKGENSALKYPLYFLVFGRRLAGSKLITFLKASFDARAPNIVSDNRYYVPNACAECHGGLAGKPPKPEYERLKLNYLDTDHWFDRIQDDFSDLKKHKCGKNYRCAVLYDGGNNQPEFEGAFAVIRQLNHEIEQQNKTVLPPNSFQWRAVSKWLELHETDSRPRDVFARALPPAGSGDPWKADNPTDKKLLPLLSRYCFRCHSSLKFNIFDKPVVVLERSKILDYMQRAIDDSRKMPQDRNLDCSDDGFTDKRTILKLVESFPTPTPAPTPVP